MRTKVQATVFLAGALLSGLASAAPLANGAAKYVGNITTRNAVRNDFGTYWNQITAENECKWGSIEGKAHGTYDFTGCDRAYKWAKDNGGHFKFHALVWGGQYPNWLKSMNATDTRKAIDAWFDRVAKQYPDLEMIDVVNEAIRTGPNSYHSPYPETKIIEALGGDANDSYAFVIEAFKMARTRWPKAVLIYNDYNTFQYQKQQGIDLINKIKAAGAPVDAYGQQAHDMMTQGGGAGGTGGGGSCLDYTTFKNTLQEIYDKTKLPLIISEYDIATTDDQIQLKCYKEQITAFMEAPFVAGITLWGYIYGATWTTGGNSGIIKNGYDASNKEQAGTDRAAMTWLKDYLSKNKGVNTTGLLGSAPATPDTVPQAPFKGAIAIPGVLEAENYDVGGQNQSYYDSDFSNQGAVYREDRVDVVAVTGGNAIGYTVKDEWLEYTVNVASEGAYDFDATVASGMDGSSFVMFIDGKAIADTVKITKGADWDTYSVVSGKTQSITAGSHILKIVISGDYTNIDKIEFKKAGTTKISAVNTNFNQGPQKFEVYSMMGAYLNSFSANSISDLKVQMDASSLKRGLYLVGSKDSAKSIVRIDR